MIADFRRTFRRTPEEILEDTKTAARLLKQAVKERQCQTCKHWTPPPKDIPDYIEHRGNCRLKHTVDTPHCSDYDLER